MKNRKAKQKIQEKMIADKLKQKYFDFHIACGWSVEQAAAMV